MRSSLRVAASVLALFLFAAATATGDPITIVDTGPGPSEVGLGWALRNHVIDGQLSVYFWAAEFSVASPVRVTSAEGWLFAFWAGVLNVSIYSDGGDIPGTEILKASVALDKLDNSIPTVSDPPAWHGPTNLDWSLAPGTYWIVFGPPPNGGMRGGMRHPSLDPLVNEAYWNGSQWISNDALDIGVRIIGEPVPEPASLLLFGTGLVGAVCAARKRRGRI